jgi:hypothetical protein
MMMLAKASSVNQGKDKSINFPSNAREIAMHHLKKNSEDTG